MITSDDNKAHARSETTVCSTDTATRELPRHESAGASDTIPPGFDLLLSMQERMRALASTGDELRVLDGFLRRLELGRRTYGPLDLRTNPRSWDRESKEEIADWAVYRAFSTLSKIYEQEDRDRVLARVPEQGEGG